METASDELITEAEKEHARKVIKELCAEVAVELGAAEAKVTARAVYHDAVTAAAKEIAATLADESVPIAKEIVSGMLKDSNQHGFVEEAVTDACKPVARQTALSAIRRWSEEKAMPLAEAAAEKVLSPEINNGSQSVLQTAVIAGLRVVLENHIANHPQVTSEDREKLFDEYLKNEEARKAAAEALSKSISPDLRRRAQTAAEHAVEEIASQATDVIAREEALNAARDVALSTAKLEISRLILAEAQRRAAKLARERLQESAQNIEQDKRAEYCQDEARKIADEAVKAVTVEIADADAAELDLEKAHELALSAASAVAREFSGAYQLTCDEQVAPISKQTIVFLVAQILLGVFIVWFFLLGGYEVCEPVMKSILPSSVYQAIYRSVPQPSEHGSDKNNDIDDLLDSTDSKDKPDPSLGPPKSGAASPEDSGPVPDPITNPANFEPAKAPAKPVEESKPAADGQAPDTTSSPKKVDEVPPG